MTCLNNINPRLFSLGIVAVSLAALGAVLVGQYFFGLHPCHLCVYQRWPFGINIALGLMGFVVASLRYPMIALAGVSFLIDAGIAVYHSGIERKWWTGLEGCSTPDMSGSIEDLVSRIQSSAVTKCDEIAWQMFGLSLANYNVLLCVVAGLTCFAYLLKRRRSSQA